MTAPFPTRKQEAWRYADLDALKPVWEQFAEPLTLTVGPGESFEEVWLPSADDVQVRRVQIALGEGASARIFVLNTASEYGRIELDVSLADDADFKLFGANIGGGTVDQRDRHHRAPHRRARPLAPDHPLGARRQGGRHLSRQGRSRARRAADRRRAIGQSHAARPRRDRQLQARARDFRRRREVRARRDASASSTPMQLFYAMSRGLDPASARALLLEGFVMGLWDDAPDGDAIRDASRDSAAERSHERRHPHQFVARRPRPVPGDRRLALSRQRRDRAETAGGDRRDHAGLRARLRDRASRRLPALVGHDGGLRSGARGRGGA